MRVVVRPHTFLPQLSTPALWQRARSLWDRLRIQNLLKISSDFLRTTENKNFATNSNWCQTPLPKGRGFSSNRAVVLCCRLWRCSHRNSQGVLRTAKDAARARTGAYIPALKGAVLRPQG